DAGVARGCAGALDHLGLAVDPDDFGRRDPTREVDGDGPRTAADVQHACPGLQGVEDIGGRVLRSTPAVRAQHALVMTVRVGVARQVHSGSGVMPAGSKKARSATILPSSPNTMWSTIGANTSRSAPAPMCTSR